MSAIGARLVRFILAEAAIRSNYTTGIVESHDEAVRRHGYSDLNEFWRDATAQKRSSEEFIDLLETFLLEPVRWHEEREGRAPRMRWSIKKAIEIAIRSSEPWVTSDPLAPGEFMIEPVQAGRWFLNNSLRCDLVPASFRDFLEGTVPPTAARAGGLKPIVSLADLRVFLESEKERLGKVPARTTAFHAAKVHFRNHKVTRRVVDAAHIGLFGRLPPGKRDT